MTDTASAADAGTMGIGGDLTVNRLGFGAMRITGSGIWGEPPDREVAKSVLKRAIELGVNFIDTADSYGPAVSETLIAEALYPYPMTSSSPRKGDTSAPARTGGRSTAGPNISRQRAREVLATATDQIPLYQLHRPDPRVRYDESVGALVELKDQGKIRHIGVSNVNEDQLRVAQR